MPRPTKNSPERGDARTRLLDAARDVIRAKGFAGTSVDDLCRAADVTKGAFFHNFGSKDALGVAAERALFVDDNRINVEAARAVGLHARLVPHFDALAPALVEAGVDVRPRENER